MLKQRLQQKIQQKLSPQQIQVIKLLEVPTFALDARIKEELEENPALEDGNLPSDYSEIANLNAATSADNENEELEQNEDEINVQEYLYDDAVKEYDWGVGYDNNEDDNHQSNNRIAIQNTFWENLQQQLNLCTLSNHNLLIAQQIIGSIDDDGYVHRPLSAIVDDLAFSQNVYVSEEAVYAMLQLIQTFDPAGVGARNLQECLKLQLQRKDKHMPFVDKAILLIENYFDDFVNKRYEKLEKNLHISTEQLRQILAEITKLNPKPGEAALLSEKQIQVIPDFVIENDNDVLVLKLNSKNAPELRISRSYHDMLLHYEKSSLKDQRLKDAVLFVKQKIDSAKWFIDAIKQRQHTLIKTMSAIMDYQYDFFLTGDDKSLKPMILKDIALKVNMDISTISRVVNSKYVLTEYGTYLLKYFFSEAIQTDEGDEVSSREIKKILKEYIEGEDKKNPLSDDRIADLMQKKGYNIARRTIAKYREQLSLPVARLRKLI